MCETGVSCNICGSTEFVEFRKRGKVRCASCGGHDRSRIFLLYLEKYANLRTGLHVLHLAPEPALFKYFAKKVGNGYDPRDVDVDRYKKLKYAAIQVNHLDLCTDTENLPSDHYDLILHNHVMEHLPCNVTAVLYHLHRSLTAGGLHMFSVPIMPGASEESLAKLSDDERNARFGQRDHIRRFGRDDLDKTLGKIFEIESFLEIKLIDHFGQQVLQKYNIPKHRWTQLTGANLLVLKKDDIKLRDQPCEH